MENVTVTVKLRKDVKNRLDILSRAKNESQTSLLARAIAEFVSNEEGKKGQANQGKARDAKKNVISFFLKKKPLSHVAPWEALHEERTAADADRY